MPPVTLANGGFLLYEFLSNAASISGLVEGEGVPYHLPFHPFPQTDVGVYTTNDSVSRNRLGDRNDDPNGDPNEQQINEPPPSKDGYPFPQASPDNKRQDYEQEAPATAAAIAT